MGISPEVREVGRSEGDKIGDGGTTSDRATREGDDGGGRGADGSNLVVIIPVIVLPVQSRVGRER